MLVHACKRREGRAHEASIYAAVDPVLIVEGLKGKNPAWAANRTLEASQVQILESGSEP